MKSDVGWRGAYLCPVVPHGQGAFQWFLGKFVCNSYEQKWVLGMPWQGSSSPFPLLVLVSSFAIKYVVLFFVRMNFGFYPWLHLLIDGLKGIGLSLSALLCVSSESVRADVEGFPWDASYRKCVLGLWKICVPARTGNGWCCSTGEKFLLVAVDKCLSAKVGKSAFNSTSVLHIALYIPKSIASYISENILQHKLLRSEWSAFFVSLVTRQRPKAAFWCTDFRQIVLKTELSPGCKLFKIWFSMACPICATERNMFLNCLGPKKGIFLEEAPEMEELTKIMLFDVSMHSDHALKQSSVVEL